MKDYALELAASQKDDNAKLNAMREYLQAYILRICHDHGLFRHAAFVGGTALRFLHDLPRFSEDLDFSLVEHKGYSFLDLIAKVKRELHMAAYDVAVTFQDAKTVQSAMIKFTGLLHAAGLSPHKDAKFLIKLEIDTNPPAGAKFQTEVVHKFFPVAFLSYEISSLFAGKINALLCRKVTKGRDFFDLGWYLSRWKDLAPNLILLENGLRQMKWAGNIPTTTDWRNIAAEAVQKASWKTIAQDVQNFLERPADMEIFTKENVLHLLRGS